MQTLGLDDKNPIEIPKKFWRRQFQQTATYSQKRFDWIFGIILPVICFAFDPVVFKGDAWGAAFLGDYKSFAYILSFISIMAMMAWLIWGTKLKWLSAPVAGLFVVGAFISLALGIVMLPISLLGLIILIGALGFTPFFFTVVYLRNGVRSFRAAKLFLTRKVLFHSFALGTILSAVVPFVINAEIHKSVEAVKWGDEAAAATAFHRLKYLSPLVNFDRLALYYHRLPEEESSTTRSNEIAKFYEEMTGRRMEDSSWVLMD